MTDNNFPNQRAAIATAQVMAAAVAGMAGQMGWQINGDPPVEILIQKALDQLGIDVESEHFKNTPTRFTKYLRQYIQPVNLDDILAEGFADDEPLIEGERTRKTLVVQTDIRFMGMCAHHLLPFFGQAVVGYLPGERLVGLSKLTRLVYAAGHLAPTTQEQITNIVADTLQNNENIKPQGVAVMAKALHGCMSARGVEAPATHTWSTALRGAFETNGDLEAKFTQMALAGMK